MITNLYINGEYCRSLLQLKTYFTNLTTESDTYYDLLDSGREGDLSKWLKTIHEDELADKISAVDTALGNSEYLNKLSEILIESLGAVKKIPFNKCASIAVEILEKRSDKVKIQILITTINSVSENFNIRITTGWGERGFIFNSSKYDEGINVPIEYNFHKRADKEFKYAMVFVDNERVFNKRISLPKVHVEESGTGTITSNQQAEQKEYDGNDFLDGIQQQLDGNIKKIFEQLGLKLEKEDKKKGWKSVTPSTSASSTCVQERNQDCQAKRYSWQTDSFLAKVNEDKRERERKLKELKRKHKNSH